MATPTAKLAASLEALSALQKSGKVAIQASDLSRTHRERLVSNGFLQEVMKGWYIPMRPDDRAGESTAWYASFWAFTAEYLKSRFGRSWCISPEQSLRLHTGNRTVPRQLIVRTPRARNRVTTFPHDTSLLDVRATMPKTADIEEKDGLLVYSLSSALIAASPTFFSQNPTDARAALAAIRDASDVLGLLLEGGHAVVAGRLAGAFRNIGRTRIADDILNAMRAAGHNTREQDPFAGPPPLVLRTREPSPYVTRIGLMWHQMRAPILQSFPKSPGMPNDVPAYLERVEENYVTDAYHSLSIEGYRVNRRLIERVRSGTWNPDGDERNREQRNAMAARGYYLAYQAVRKSVTRILGNENPGAVVDDDHGTWYREMFAPSVAIGLLKPADLAGYRNDQVYIRRSMHVPPQRDAVRELMPVFFDLLREEAEPAVRVVLGHFVFVYIHPYMDGNGRVARFLMNAMLASGGYPWTVVPVEGRDAYMAALEDASVRQDIKPFAEYLAGLVKASLKGRPTAKPPKK
jgi:Fic family protein